MKLRYDEDFVEAGVGLCATGRYKGVSALHILRFNRERERLYDILDPDDRNDAFFRLHLEWFREWGLEKLLTEPLNAFPLLDNALKTLAFRKPRGKHDEGAELYVNEAAERSGVVAVRPERLCPGPELEGFLFHEFAHLHDMVDPTFGYRPELALPHHAPGQERLARERYRLLWAIAIDGRLTRAGRSTLSTWDRRWQEFVVAFPFWPESKQRAVFESLWANPSASHSELEKLVCDPRQPGLSARPGPGALCPLCGFPTFSWAEPAVLRDPIAAAIRAEFPHWLPEQGACARCLAVYRSNRASPLLLKP
jgi:hypothetical protein